MTTNSSFNFNDSFQRQSYRHILACINTYLNDGGDTDRVIHILDAGCGDGKLIAYFRKLLPVLHPKTNFIFMGFDVHDHGVQEKGFLSNSIKYLSEAFPLDNWEDKISIIGSGDKWVHPDSSIDFVISNQVLEHVINLPHFFSELSRVLKNGGISIHLFPTRHIIVEPHIRIPFVHWISSWDLMKSYIKSFIRTGISQYYGKSFNNYSEQHADYLLHNTNYKTEEELYDICKSFSLRASFRYTSEFYSGKVRSILGLKSRILYKNYNRSLYDALSIKFLRYVSDVTLCIEKKNTYKR